MKIYIAGKITGDPGYQQKFADVEAALAQLGYVVLNPARNPAGLDRAEYMRLSFAMVDMADRVAFLPDWEDSAGARIERAFCEYISKEIFDL